MSSIESRPNKGSQRVFTPEVSGIRRATAKIHRASDLYLGSVTDNPVFAREAKEPRENRYVGYYKEFHWMSPEQWRTMDAGAYQRFETLTADLMFDVALREPDAKLERGHVRDRHLIRLPVDGSRPRELKKDHVQERYGLISHIKVMQGLMSEYWDQGLSDLFPEGSTLDYAHMLGIAHDMERFIGVNGSVIQREGHGALPWSFAEQASEVLLNRFFPGMPHKEDLHGMDMIIDRAVGREKEEPTPLQLVLKLFDTCGKPDPRHPKEFFAPNGGYWNWVRSYESKGEFPFLVTNTTKNDEGKYQTEKVTVTSDAFAAADISLTMEGYNYVQNNLGLDFDEVIDKVTTQVDDETETWYFGDFDVDRGSTRLLRTLIRQ